MTWKDFYAHLKENALQGAYLFAGPEEYLKREALQALRRALLPAGLEQLNEAVLEGATAAQVIEAAETLPFLCERRIVEVRDWAPLLGGKARDEENEAARMLAWLDNAPRKLRGGFHRTRRAGRAQEACAGAEKTRRGSAL